MNTDLTPVQAQTLRYVGRGYTDRKIAERRGVSPQAVKNQVSNLREKFDAVNRVDLAVKAAKAGLIVFALLTSGIAIDIDKSRRPHIRRTPIVLALSH